MICKTCGGRMISDPHTVTHCEFAEGIEYCEPDAAPRHCEYPIADILGRARLLAAHQDELALQNAIESTLNLCNIPYSREHRLGINDRPDFMVGGTAIEVKVAGSSDDVARQLQRYSKHKSVARIVLVTTKRTHKIDYTKIGKPVDVVVLDRGLC